MKEIICILVSMAMLSLLVGCSTDSLEESTIGVSDSVVSIGFADQKGYYVDVLKLVQEDIERLDSPVEIQLVQKYDYMDYTEGLSVAQSFCEDTTMVGVVGHLYSDLCLSLKSVYDESMLPLLVPYVSSNKLLEDTNGYVYQTATNMDGVSEMYMAMVKLKDNQNIAVVYGNTAYGNELSKNFEQYINSQLTGYGSIAKIVDKVCTPNVSTELPECIKKWKALDADAIMIFGDGGLLVDYITDIREFSNDIDVYIASDYENFLLLFYSDIAEYDNIYQLSFLQYDDNPEIEDLFTRFEETYGYRMDDSMMQVYDDIMIIAKAIAYNGVRTREDLKEFLDTSESIGSIYGDELYFKDNYIQNKSIFVQKYNASGDLTYSVGSINNDLDILWNDFSMEEYLDEYLWVGEYDNE